MKKGVACSVIGFCVIGIRLYYFCQVAVFIIKVAGGVAFPVYFFDLLSQQVVSAVNASPAVSFPDQVASLIVGVSRGSFDPACLVCLCFFYQTV